MIRERQVYNALTYHWQTGQIIRQKVADNLGKKRTQITAALICVHLDSLVGQGFAEYRQATLTPEQLEQRRGLEAREYRKIGEKEYKRPVPYEILQPVPLS